MLLFLTSTKQNNYLILQTACLSTHSAQKMTEGLPIARATACCNAFVMTFSWSTGNKNVTFVVTFEI